MTPAEKLLTVALAEVGYLEKASNRDLDSKTANAGTKNFTKYARDLDEIGTIFNGKKQGYAWCAVYAIWCFVRAFGVDTAMRMLNIPKKSSAAGVGSLAGYLKSAGRFKTANPEPGDLIFFYAANLSSWAHVGLVERVEGGRVYTVEGNTSAASGVISNGGGVARKSYTINYNRIAGYGRPDWSLAPGEEDDDMTGEEIIRKVQDYLSTQPVPDWAKLEMQEAVKLGITDGSDPMLLIPRYQAAIMAKRAMKAAMSK